MGLAPLTNKSYRQRVGVYRDPLLDVGVGTGQAFATGAESGLMGPGSMGESIQQYMVERDTGRQDDSFWGDVGYTMGKVGFSLGSFFGMTGDLDRDGVKLSREEWEKSEYYRPELEYKDGLTDVSAAVLADRHDRDRKASAVMEQANLFQSGAAMTGTIATAIFDVKNVAAGMGAYAALRGVAAGTSATILAREAAVARKSTTLAFGFSASGRPVTIGEAALQGATSVKQGVRVMAAEAAIGTVPISMTAMEASKSLQTEYGWGDFAADLFSSVGVTVGISAFSRAMSNIWSSHVSKREANVILDLARAQLQRGEPLNLKPLLDMQLAERHVPITTLAKEQMADAIVERVGKKKLYEAWYPNERGEMSVVRGKGKTPEEALAELKRIYETADVTGQKETQYSQTYYKKLLNYEQMKKQIDEFDVDKQAEEEFKGRTGYSAKEERAAITKQMKNAKKRKAQAEAEARGSTFYEQLIASYDTVKARQKQLEKAVVDAKKDLIETKKAEKMPAFQEWVKKQVGEDDIPLVREEIEEKAGTVESADKAAPSEEIARMREMINDETIPQAQRRDIENAIRQYDAIQKLPDVVEKFIACRGGRL